MTTSRLLAPVLLAVVAVATACGGAVDDTAAPEVASLPSSASGVPSAPADDGPATPAGATGSAGTAGERPQFRVDDSDERRQRIWDTYYACLVDHGAPKTTARVATSPVDMDQVAPETLAACADLEPVQPPALDGATNPDFEEDLQAYVQCMKDDGLHVTLYGPPGEINWTYAEGHPVPEDSYEIESRCLVEGFGAA